jgi:hypothetical protein
MTHTRPPSRPRIRKKYAIIWLLGTATAVLVSYAGIRGIYSSGASAAKSDPVVTPTPPLAATPTPSPSYTPSPKPATPKPKPKPKPPRPHPFQGVRISSPQNGAKVNGSVGVLLKGRYGDLGGDELRVFVLAFNGQYYLNDNGPVLSDNGTWNFLVKPIGAGTSDIGRVFTIIVATVNSACRATLQASNRAPDGNIAFPVLPAGCRAAAKVDVLKTAF